MIANFKTSFDFLVAQVADEHAQKVGGNHVKSLTVGRSPYEMQFWPHEGTEIGLRLNASFRLNFRHVCGEFVVTRRSLDWPQ